MNRGDVKLIIDRCIAHDVPDAADLIERQAAQIEMMREFIARAHVSSGVCCCGEAIDGHSSPMSCGHSPVDLWDHSVEQILATTPDQALEQFAGLQLVMRQAALQPFNITFFNGQSATNRTIHMESQWL